MRATSAMVFAVLVLGACRLDTSGTGTSDELVSDGGEDATADTIAPPADDAAPDDLDAEADDTLAADTFVADTEADDTFVPDTFVPDTFVPDTFVPDTFVPDTFVPDMGSDTAPPCSEPNSGVYNGHCYFLDTTSGGWTAARDGCAAASSTGHPAYLAVITTSGEWSFVNGLPGGGSFGRWIGLSSSMVSAKKSDFTWVNGETFAYDAWMAGHPNKSGNCVVMHSPGFTPPGSWEDVACTTAYERICERE